MVWQNSDEKVLSIEFVDAESTNQVLQGLLDALEQHIGTYREEVISNDLVNLLIFFMGNVGTINSKEFASKDLVSDVKKAWIEMTGKKEEDIQDVKVYVKPEENKAYYVVNGEASDDFKVIL